MCEQTIQSECWKQIDGDFISTIDEDIANWLYGMAVFHGSERAILLLHEAINKLEVYFPLVPSDGLGVKTIYCLARSDPKELLALLIENSQIAIDKP